MPDITVAGRDGNFSAYLALPKKTPAPGVLVAQEIFGVNAVMRGVCNWLAGEGFVALCPDLFWRIEPGIQITDKTQAEWKRAFELFGLFDVDRGIDDMMSALQALRGHEACTGKAGTIGYCLGGKLAYLMATRSSTDCAVGYYGVGLQELLEEAENIKKPLMLHIAEEDQFVPKAAQKEIKAGLRGHPEVTIHSYPGRDHAFARKGGEHYHPADTKTANQRTIAFLKEHLA